jgi:hypothetical protein
MNPFRTASSRAVEDGQSTLTMPAFSGPTPTCRKCLHKNIVGPHDKYDAVSDTISRKCTSCSFTWVERAADSGSAAPR